MLLLGALNQANVDVACGQQLDAYNVSSRLDDFDEDKLLLIHILKASSYSTQLPMEWAALLLGLSNDENRKIAAFARPFGILYQLVDDYSDYFANDSVFNNRPKYRDFRQGKVTYPLYCALRMVSPTQHDHIKRKLGQKQLSDADMRDIVAMFEECGAQATSREYLERFFDETTSALKALAIQPEAKRHFTALLATYRP